MSAWMLALVLVHGCSGRGCSLRRGLHDQPVPERRRGEGIGYWGLSTLAGVALAPAVGFWMYSRGWLWLCIGSAVLNLVMAIIATQLHDDQPKPSTVPKERKRGVLEWRVLIVSITLALYSFGYGGITSFTAMYADANGVVPKGLYLTTLAIVILLTRPISAIGDRWATPGFVSVPGPDHHRSRVLAFGGTRGYSASAVIFGVGFGTRTAYSVVMKEVAQSVEALPSEQSSPPSTPASAPDPPPWAGSSPYGFATPSDSGSARGHGLLYFF